MRLLFRGVFYGVFFRRKGEKKLANLRSIIGSFKKRLANLWLIIGSLKKRLANLWLIIGSNINILAFILRGYLIF
jgi:hypothetical protein